MTTPTLKTPFTGPEMSETKTFTWRLRPHETHITGTGTFANGTGSGPGKSNDGGSIGSTSTGAGALASPALNPARYSKSTNLSGLVGARVGGTTTGGGTNASHSLSSSVLPTTPSTLQFQQSQQQQPQQLEKFLRFQEFEVEAGQSLGLHSNWSIFLISCGSTTLTNQKSNTNLPGIVAAGSNGFGSSANPSANSDFVGVFLRKIHKGSSSNKSRNNYSSTGDQILARYKLEIMDRDGAVKYKKELESVAKDKFEVGFWDWKKIVPISTFYNTKKISTDTNNSGGSGGAAAHHQIQNVEDSILLLRVSFTLVTQRREQINKGINKAKNLLTSEEEISTRKAANAFLSLAASGPKALEPDVLIEIPNRKKFSVHKTMLIERSPLFHKMLDAESKEKIRGNIIKVNDMSVNGMELILRHIYTGQLEEEWVTNPATITELIIASDKYGLPALKEFCSKHLVRAANKDNCYKLMQVARLHNLEQAAEDLMAYASEGLGSNVNSRKASVESVDSETSN